MQNPVIFIHGILASELQDQYQLDPETLYSAVLNKNYERLYLHPNNINYEAQEPALVRPGKPFGITYGDLINSLRHELSPSHSVNTPVFSFSYDWRMDIGITADLLSGFIQEVRERCYLMRDYNGEHPQVDIVTHSMGSLVFAQYFSKHGNEKWVRKIATIAGPFMGSLEAVVMLSNGMGYLSGSQPDERQREMARMGVSVYQMLPRFKNAVQPRDGVSGDLFKADSWQSGIAATIQQYIDQYGLPSQKLDPQTILQGFLDKASAFGGLIQNLSFKGTGIDPARDWLAIVGVGARTRVQMEIGPGPRFVISDDDFVDHWEDGKTPEEKYMTGDTTVPLGGAVPPFLAKENIVSVSPHEFGIFELGDKALNALIGLHAQLPNMDLVQRLVIKHLKPDYTGEVKGRPLPDVPAAKWAPPIQGLPPA